MLTSIEQVKPALPRQSSTTYLPQLDGLRFFAVGLVLYDHWAIGYNTLPLGPLGVVLFFVLSGFLITRILFASQSADTYTDKPNLRRYLTRFYIRRSLRIFPVYYACLLVMYLTDVPPVREKFWWCALYATNLYVAFTGQWLGLLDHSWSLAVEEQYYLIFPLLLFCIPKRQAPFFFLFLIAGSVYFRFWLHQNGHPWTVGYVSMPGCLDAFGIGALMAYGWLYKPALFNRIFSGYFAIAMSIVLFFTVVLYSHTFSAYHNIVSDVWERLFAAILSAFLIGRAILGFGQPVRWLLENPVSRYLGQISYGIYLIHNLVFNYYHTTATSLTLRIWNKAGSYLPVLEEVPQLQVVYFFALTVLLAALSWHLMEKPINSLKDKFAY
ncbi:acyltransferase [Nibrella saemangeumensis]|uniref:Acyltransferase n=1 Tax=Nibrella saemangeumensis TaxID=1084526 RepID=A0ABP8N658_9BACT